jgi:hypothetical protein
MGGTEVTVSAPLGAGPALGSAVETQRRRFATAVAYAGAGVLLFLVYLRLSMTEQLNSDSANILLMGWDMLHGHLLLHGWYASDVAFLTTEIPQYALLTAIFGLHAQTAHVAAAMTYTLVFLLAVALARAGATSRASAGARTLIAGGIMLAPQLGLGVFALVLSVGHIGTAVPLLLTWLLLDRAERTGDRRWYLPVLAMLLLTWVEIADPIVLILGIAPLAIAASVRAAQCFRDGQGRDRRYYMALALAGPAAYGLAWVLEQALRAMGAIRVNSLPFYITPWHDLAHNMPAAWKVLQIFGANPIGLGGMQLFLALVHLASVVVVGVAMLIALPRFFRPGKSVLTDQILLVAITLNIALFMLTNAANLASHEVAIILPFGAVLAARQLTTVAVPRWMRLTAATAGVAVLAVYTVGLGYNVTRPTMPMQNTGLATWLERHHLTYGLAGYWASSSVTLDSGGKVKVRALMQFTMQDDLWMSDKAWYDPKAHYANFIVLDSKSDYYDHWEPVALIRKYFGTPARVYHYGIYTIWVWNRNLLPEVPGNT